MKTPERERGKASEPAPETPAADTAANPPKSGEFTGLFSQSKAAPAVPQGEFTRMFELPRPDAAASEEGATFKQPPARVQPPAESRPSKAASGDFTRAFRPEEARRSGSSQTNWLDFTEKPQQGDDSLKEISWDLPRDQAATGAFAARSSSPLQSPPVEQGPSEFTKLIALRPSPPKPEIPAPPVETKQPEPPKPSRPLMANLPVLLAVNVMLITAIAVILYFVLKR